MGWISVRQRRHVTFFKRKKGLFRNAQQLCCLTGATIGIICFSEAGIPSPSPTLLCPMIETEIWAPTTPVAESKSFSEEHNSSGLP
ncbi:hypothetical protein EJ110_NYTH55128 [Nymphaea thermarum]|nr:hypothetical protein EJ110_NYTH55128 [Nymphaea thermarum]